ncbi:MAG: hypothetical protein Q4P13_06590, partial [Psychrobacter sp.]|nr:hypothetical protein [Psychrobacter sp.]
MNKLKSILIGLILLTVTLLMAVLTWLWQHNIKNINPLPIPASPQDLIAPVASEANDSTLGNVIGDGVNTNQTPNADNAGTQITICADDELRAPLNVVLVNFERRYPNLDAQVVYLKHSQMLSRQGLIKGCDMAQSDLLLFSQPIPPNLLKE